MKTLGTNSGPMTALAGRVHSWETGSGDERTCSGTDLEAHSRASGTDSELDSDGPSWAARADTGLDYNRPSWTARTNTGLDWGAATGGRSGGAVTEAGADTGGFWTRAVAERTGSSVLACGDNSGLLRNCLHCHCRKIALLEPDLCCQDIGSGLLDNSFNGRDNVSGLLRIGLHGRSWGI